ncbi:polysaccharide biosynthesis protein [Hymenobacter psoromatis]|uniref:polysaccharide biosynthesis protein n=1 Tax=Hymenobacter psoromatis TaxID=1484116 RepID=UPI001CBDE396|nr:polysaccharide biosynthesis protein [Hymenobacter psoromatis]
MVGTMLLLADGGITAGVMAQGGRVWQSRERLGAVLATGYNLRRKFALVSLLLAIPSLLYLLRHQEASWLMSLLLTASLIPGFLMALSGTLLEIAPKLHQSVLPIQRIQVEASLSRLVLLSSLLLFPWAYVAVLAAGLPQIWANRRLSRLAGTFADDQQPLDPVVRQEILAKVKRLLPDAIYYCFSCQFVVWLISIYGSTTALAQVGALGRLAVALSLFSTLFASLVLPRFARLPNDVSLLFRHYTRLVVGLLALGTCIVAGIWLLATPILWVLGKQYAGLEPELILMMVGRCLGLVASSVFLLCTSKGWVINPLLSIPLSLASIGVGIALIDITTLQGIFKLDIVVALVQLLMHISYGLSQLLKLKQVATSLHLREEPEIQAAHF